MFKNFDTSHKNSGFLRGAKQALRAAFEPAEGAGGNGGAIAAEGKAFPYNFFLISLSLFKASFRVSSFFAKCRRT